MRKFLALVVLSLIMVGCDQPTNQVLPTLIPTLGGPVESPSETPASTEPTQPPTNAPSSRPTLPPTWTPAGENALTAIPTEASGTGATQAPPQTTGDTGLTTQPTLVVCGTFVADRQNSTSTFNIGQAPVVNWSRVDTAGRYRISLVDQFGVELFMDYALEPTYTFKSDLFERGKRYGWAVYPEDAFGQQMCLERGSELFPQ